MAQKTDPFLIRSECDIKERPQEEQENSQKSSTFERDSRKSSIFERDSPLFLEKYRPKHLAEFARWSNNQASVDQLMNLALSDDLPHMIFQGPPGCGKKTLANLFLQEKFGATVVHPKMRWLDFKYPGKEIQLRLVHSQHHYQVDFSAARGHDRHVIHDFLKEAISYATVGKCPYRIVVIERADELTLEAQQSLRRMLETSIRVCRFVFLCVRSLHEALVSRCVTIRLVPPTAHERMNLERHIIATESKFADLQESGSRSGAGFSDVYWRIQFSRLGGVQGTERYSYDPWTDAVRDLAKKVSRLTSVMGVLEIRAGLIELLSIDLDPVWIAKELVRTFLERAPANMQFKLVKELARAEEDLRRGSRPLFHLERLVIEVLSLNLGLA
ncbi:MAG: replication factor C small subunit [Sulfobacillus sp.]